MTQPDYRPPPKGPDWKVVAWIAGTALAGLVTIFVNEMIQGVTENARDISDMKTKDAQDIGDLKAKTAKLEERAAAFGSRLDRVEDLQNRIIGSMGRAVTRAVFDDDEGRGDHHPD